MEFYKSITVFNGLMIQCEREKRIRFPAMNMREETYYSLGSWGPAAE